MRGTCVELAKNVAHGKRVAHHGHAPLHTPKGSLAHGAAAGHTKGGVGAKHPPAAAGMAPTDPFSDVGVEVDDSEGEADSVEVKDAVDESGAVRITD